jgi:dTDP-4-amino-4,6-dideoxygalactose transaminase
MVVHMGGLAVEMEAFRKVLPDRVAIIEDAAHGLGSRFADGKPVGSSGNLACFSFYANKNLSTAEGGAIALFDETKAGRLSSLRQHSLTADAWKRFTESQCALIPGIRELGYKMNFTDLQASFGRVQLRRQGEFHTIRLGIAEKYCEALPQINPSIKWQANLLRPHHSRHLFQILLPLEEIALTRNDLLLQLRSRNVGASIHYAPLHFMPLYGANQPSLPSTELICNRIMTLPISSSMTIADADYVLDQLKELCG